MMTGPTTSSLFTANAWQMNNSIQISSLSGGAFLSTSYLHIRDTTNSSTLLTLQSDGIADFGKSIPRASTLAMGAYDLVNLSTLSNAISYIEGITSLNFVPYSGAKNNLSMGGSTITTSGLISAGALRITSSISNQDYSISVNGSDQLEITNLTTAKTLKTDGSSLFIPGNVNCYTGTVYSTDLQLSGTSFLAYGTASQFGTTLNGSGEYVIQDDAGLTRLKVSKTTGLTISTLNITNVPSLTPSLALGVNGGGQVVSFAVPTATNILPLANTFTNTNTFNSTMTTGVGYTTSLNGVLSTNLNDLGFTSASFTTSGITGAYSAPLGTITNVSGSTYQIAQTASGRSIMAISGFTPVVGTTYVFSFNIKCTIGTATIVVEQNNLIRSPQYYQLSTGFNRVVGTFYYDGTGNTLIFNIYTGTLSWNAQWDSFTLSTYYATANCNVSTLGSNRFIQSYNAISTDYSTLVNRQTMDSAISAIPLPPNLLPLNNVWTGSNTYNNSLQVAGGNMTCSLGTIAKQTATVGSLVQITGGGSTSSPYMEFLFGGNSRGYIGSTTATDMNIVAQNGAQLNFWTAGSSRVKIDTSGNLVMNIQKALYLYFTSATNNAGLLTNASGDVSIFTGTSAPANRLTITAGGETVSPALGTYGQFRAISGGYGWFIRNDAANTYFLLTANNDQYGSWNSLRPFYMNNVSGAVSMENGFGVSSRYFYSPESAGATYGSICIKGTGRNGWTGYSIVNDAVQQVSFMMANGSQSYGFYQPSNNIWTFFIDSSSGDVRIANAGGTRGFNTNNAITCNTIYNTTATTASNITTWNGYGYTLLSNSQFPGGNAACMGLGCNYSNTCQITCLAPAVSWMNLAIFNAQTTFTYYGVACGYTVPSGGANVSDVREKHSISDVNTKNSLRKIMAIKPKYYKRKYYDGVNEKGEKLTPVPDHVKDQMCIGVMAQDLLETGILAPAVSVAPMKNENIVPTADDDGTRWGVNYGDINIHMIGAVQELKKQNDAQQEKLDQLERIVSDQNKLLEFLLAKIK
jgi:hypothetical protein